MHVYMMSEAVPLKKIGGVAETYAVHKDYFSSNDEILRRAKEARINKSPGLKRNKKGQFTS
jgi:hypothetical protein